MPGSEKLPTNASGRSPLSRRAWSAQNELNRQWITTQVDADHTTKHGPGWRAKVLGGTYHQALAGVSVKKYGAFFAPTDEYLFAKRAADALNLSQSAFLRLCVAQFLIAHGYATPEQIPVMAEHVR